VGTDQPPGSRLPAYSAHPPPLAVYSFRRQLPKVEAECLNQARSVLCGGRPAMGVLTAIRSTDAPITEPRRLDIKARQCEAGLDV
jgi:hypothetical protein